MEDLTGLAAGTPPVDRSRRTRGEIARDREALDAIKAILDKPLTCRRSELPAIDRETIRQIGDIVDVVRPD